MDHQSPQAVLHILQFFRYVIRIVKKLAPFLLSKDICMKSPITDPKFHRLLQSLQMKMDDFAKLDENKDKSINYLRLDLCIQFLIDRDIRRLKRSAIPSSRNEWRMKWWKQPNQQFSFRSWSCKKWRRLRWSAHTHSIEETCRFFESFSIAK